MEGFSGFTGSQVRIAERINGKNATGRKQKLVSDSQRLILAMCSGKRESLGPLFWRRGTWAWDNFPRKYNAGGNELQAYLHWWQVRGKERRLKVLENHCWQMLEEEEKKC